MRQTIHDFINAQGITAGGPGSGRHKTTFTLSQRATGNQVGDALKSAGYSRDPNQSGHFTHPDGHEAQHVDRGGNQSPSLKVHAIGSDPEDHFGDVEAKLSDKGLLGY